MAQLNISSDLFQGLEALDEFLCKEGERLAVLLVGANGMRSQGLITRGSRDLDNYHEMSAKVREAVAMIGDRLGLDPDWLNDAASDIPLPEGAFQRSVPIAAGFRQLEFSTLSRIDFLFLKVAAAVQRMADDPRDVDDLREAGITADEFEAALLFVRSHFNPGDPKFAAYQHEDIEELRRVLFES